jgi:hypothetical protein
MAMTPTMTHRAVAKIAFQLDHPEQQACSQPSESCAHSWHGKADPDEFFEAPGGQPDRETGDLNGRRIHLGVEKCEGKSRTSRSSGIVQSATPYHRRLTRHRPMRDNSAGSLARPSTIIVRVMPARLGPASIARNMSSTSAILSASLNPLPQLRQECRPM